MVKVKDIKKKYSFNEVLRGVSFEAGQKQEITSITSSAHSLDSIFQEVCSG